MNRADKVMLSCIWHKVQYCCYAHLILCGWWGFRTHSYKGWDISSGNERSSGRTTVMALPGLCAALPSSQRTDTVWQRSQQLLLTLAVCSVPWGGRGRAGLRGNIWGFYAAVQRYGWNLEIWHPLLYEWDPVAWQSFNYYSQSFIMVFFTLFTSFLKQHHDLDLEKMKFRIYNFQRILDYASESWLLEFFFVIDTWKPLL